MVGAGICAADDERELTISRRPFIFCGAVALLPLPADPYDRFLAELRSRLIQLAENGFVVERFEIAPPRHGQRILSWYGVLRVEGGSCVHSL
jgi:hypothetical protein